MWLLEGQKAPDHNTIARFRSRLLTDVVEDLFCQLVMKLEQAGEISFQTLFVDGTKIEAFISKLNEDFGFTYSPDTPLVEIHGVLSQKKDSEKVEFVHRTGKRKTMLQKAMETLEEFLTRQQKYQDYQEKFRGRNSFSKTDKDATFMHMTYCYIKPANYETSKIRKFRNDMSLRDNMLYDEEADVYTC